MLKVQGMDVGGGVIGKKGVGGEGGGTDEVSSPLREHLCVQGQPSVYVTMYKIHKQKHRQHYPFDTLDK